MIVFVVFVSSVFAYCNETRTITMANETAASSNYNESVTRVCSDDLGFEAATPLTLFLLFIIGGLFFLSFRKKLFDNPILDFVVKKCSQIVATMLLSFSMVLMASIIKSANLGLSEEVFVFMNLLNWGAYCLMAYLVLNLLFKSLKLMADNAQRKRVGE